MQISDKTLVLIMVIVIFTVTFISSALITYKIRRKKSENENMPNTKRKDKIT
ncbi:MAG: hypothetical protein K2J32_09175 [Ruminococcus sp.]|nr:hypothetical protein [Ruminococcus sp.]